MNGWVNTSKKNNRHTIKRKLSCNSNEYLRKSISSRLLLIIPQYDKLLEYMLTIFKEYAHNSGSKMRMTGWGLISIVKNAEDHTIRYANRRHIYLSQPIHCLTHNYTRQKYDFPVYFAKQHNYCDQGSIYNNIKTTMSFCVNHVASFYLDFINKIWNKSLICCTAGYYGNDDIIFMRCIFDEYLYDEPEVEFEILDSNYVIMTKYNSDIKSLYYYLSENLCLDIMRIIMQLLVKVSII